jgi:hypothetical protein
MSTLARRGSDRPEFRIGLRAARALPAKRSSPRNPSSDPTLKIYDLRGDEGNIAELAATTVVALIIALLSVRTIEYT